MTLTALVANHAASAAQAVAQEINANPATHSELIQQLEGIWARERADHSADDEAWLRAVARLSRETLNAIHDIAYRNEYYAAARCLAWHRAQLR